MSTGASNQRLAEVTPTTTSGKACQQELRRLICPSWSGGQMQFDSTAFNLDFSSAVTPKNEDDGTNDVSDDDSSIASNGSCITIETHSPDSINDPTLV
jgi:hypothetical protein